MKRKMTFALLLSCLLMVGIASAGQGLPWMPKEKAVCNHNADFDLWDSIRIRPVTFTDFDGDTAYWKSTDLHTVKLGSFVFTDQSEFYSLKETKENQLYLIMHKDHRWL